MRAIIHGVRYDTEKAELIGETCSGLYTSDFHWWSAGLYVTPRSRRYFLAGKGGPLTQFSRHIGLSERASGSRIIPLDEDDALTWAEDFLLPEDVEKYFGHLIKDA